MPKSIILVVSLALPGCAAATDQSAPPPAPSQATPAAHEDVHDASSRPDDRFRPIVEAVARGYKDWPLVDDELHWAPGLCNLPLRGGEHISAAEGSAHDGKLFRLHTVDIEGYAAAVGWIREPNRGPMPGTSVAVAPSPEVVQALVKDSFVAKPFEPGMQPSQGAGFPTRRLEVHTAMRDGRPFVAGDPIGLFIMVKLADAADDGTDAGWIYGTVAPDGEVTAAGVVDECRACHSTRKDRLFGLPRPPRLGM